MGSSWHEPGSASRRLRLVVFAAVALAAVIVVLALIALVYTAPVG